MKKLTTKPSFKKEWAKLKILKNNSDIRKEQIFLSMKKIINFEKTIQVKNDAFIKRINDVLILHQFIQISKGTNASFGISVTHSENVIINKNKISTIDSLGNNNIQPYSDTLKKQSPSSNKGSSKFFLTIIDNKILISNMNNVNFEKNKEMIAFTSGTNLNQTIQDIALNGLLYMQINSSNMLLNKKTPLISYQEDKSNKLIKINDEKLLSELLGEETYNEIFLPIKNNFEFLKEEKEFNSDILDEITWQIKKFGIGSIKNINTKFEELKTENNLLNKKLKELGIDIDTEISEW